MSGDLLRLKRNAREVARWQKAQEQVLGERHAPALASYRYLVKRFPGVEQLWFELGLAAAGELEFALAAQAFERAETLAPRDASLLILLGQQYHRLRRLDRARACFERAFAVEPESLNAGLSLAAWYERERRLDAAWECIEQCVARHPHNLQAQCVRALLLHRLGRNSEAEGVLREVLRSGSADLNVNFSSRHLLGVVLDQMGNYTEAMRWLVEAKAYARRMANTAQMERDYDRADERRRELLAGLRPEMIRRWREEGPAVPWRAQLAFLGGHPRSGTTLLEQILGVHPELAAFDESEAFPREVWQELAPLQAAQPLTCSGLDHLSEVRRAALSRQYLLSLLRETGREPGAQVWLDKNPSPTAALHLWLRLFPQSKVVIALRDPRDVVLSCFFQNLMLTPASANFLSLERTARHYADLMDTWLRLRELGGFDWLETRYEEVVANLESEGRRVTEFLGLSWHANQAKHREVGRSRFLFAPTFNDVSQPVYTRSVGRWAHYAEAMAPVQERLAPYCRAFGYS